ncbi:MAG: hypothetical protein ABJG15_08550 [Hyphomonadaceae bacterium]
MHSAKAALTLQKLVGVKKRRAEQRLSEVRMARERIANEIGDIRKSLTKKSLEIAAFRDASIAAQNGLPERMFQKLQQLKYQDLALEQERKLIEVELKSALHAERELGGKN